MRTDEQSYTGGKRICLYALLGWAAVAMVLVALGVFARLPVPAAQGAIAAQMLIFLIGLWFSPAIRAYLFSRDLRRLTLFHMWRVIPGVLFLFYYYKLDLLPASFALPGGYGDIAVATTAPLAALLPASSWRLKWRALLVWHVLSFLDLANVVRAGLANGRLNPESMRPLTHFPLSLLPAMLVSLTFIVHIIAIAQLVRRNSLEAPDAVRTGAKKPRVL